ncbi:pyridoxamine 5'-phosphate oxidase family protein [uncultured Cohaesibacter sp.]|uniref:pyridoxamine 5'-phosphate oxidase family protein n=1 Tax=uncultured Cohaesibacter sp. TaxID=1002546 RepID=UPI00374A4BA7
MAKQFEKLNDIHRKFIERQHIFFTASATKDSRVNISPREAGALRILDDNTIIYMDKTGSGNETSAHLLTDGRLTIMFCSFSGPPMILRLYGTGDSIGWETEEFRELATRLYPDSTPLSARKIVRLKFDLVQTSCGYGVPMFDYQEDRDVLDNWAKGKGRDGIRDYWQEKNLKSMDGLPTGLETGA